MKMTDEKKKKTLRRTFRRKSAKQTQEIKESPLCEKHAEWAQRLKALKEYAGTETSIYIAGVASRARILPTEEERLDFTALAVKVSQEFGIRKNRRTSFIRQIIRDIETDFGSGNQEYRM